MSTSSFPKLEQFFGAYFHQDWPLEASSSAEVVEAYRKKASEKAIRDLRTELAALRAEKLTETQLRKRIESMGACIDPAAEGRTYQRWLEGLESALTPLPVGTGKTRTSR